MSKGDDSIFEKVLRVETKDIFVDLKKNKNGTYLKISERNGTTRNTVLIPASGLERLKAVLDDAVISAKEHGITSRLRKPRLIDPEVKSRSVYVSGLSYNTIDAELFEHMSAAGKVLKAVVLRIKNRRSLGCGIVEYESREIALHALKEMNDTKLGDRKIHCREDRDSADVDEDGQLPPINDESLSSSAAINATPAPTSSERQLLQNKVLDEKRVFCSNLSWDTSPEELAEHLSSVGEVVDVEILRRNGRSLGCGFVEFSETESVALAISQLHNAELKGRKLIVREYYQ